MQRQRDQLGTMFKTSRRPCVLRAIDCGHREVKVLRRSPHRTSSPRIGHASGSRSPVVGLTKYVTISSQASPWTNSIHHYSYPLCLSLLPNLINNRSLPRKSDVCQSNLLIYRLLGRRQIWITEKHIVI